jgi:cell division protein FtsB
MNEGLENIIEIEELEKEITKLKKENKELKEDNKKLAKEVYDKANLVERLRGKGLV